MKFTITILALYFFTISTHSRADPVAQYVWHQVQGDFRVILLASFNGENWEEPVEIHRTDQPIWSVTLGSDRLGNQLLIWTELYKDTSILKQKSYLASSGRWNDATLLSNYGTENIGATILFDLQNRAWVAWAENGTGQSDIVAIYRERDGNWSQPFRVNEVNEVPDIAPNASLNKNGEIIVTWSTYSVDENDYVMRSKIISTENQISPKQQKMSVDRVAPEEVPTPNFASKTGASTIHFPNNLIIQSRTILPTFVSTN